MSSQNNTEKANVLFDEIEELREFTGKVYDEVKALMEFHPRAAKLMKKRKNFLVVACDEPYFPQVYKIIRSREIEIGRWTKEDEEKYSSAMDAWNASNASINNF
jgi:hypothetical protein